MNNKPILQPKDIPIVIKRYNSGESSESISKDYFTSRQIILKYLKKNGACLRPPGSPKGSISPQRIITNIPKLIKEYESGLSTVKLAKKYKTNAITINHSLKRAGIKLRTLSEAHADFSGKNHPNYKGKKGKHKKAGKYTEDGIYLNYDGKGYLRRTVKGHPLASKSGSIGEHVYQACLKYGVDFVKGKDVHHENDIKDDNSWDNLIPLTRKKHRQLENNFTKNSTVIFPDKSAVIAWLKAHNLPTTMEIQNP